MSDDAGNQGATVARFAAGLAPHGSGTVVAGRDGSASGTAAVAVTRSDAALNGAVSTVDDVDAESGRITTVLALSDLINGGRPGQYGVGQGASSVHRIVPQVGPVSECPARRVSDGLSASVLRWGSVGRQAPS